MRIPCSVVDPDPNSDGYEIICKLGSGSVLNFGSGSRFESESKLSCISIQQIKSSKNVKIEFFKVFLRSSDYLRFKCIFHKQSEFECKSKLSSLFPSVVHSDPAGSEIIYKLGSGSVINSGSDSGSGFESGSKLSSASN